MDASTFKIAILLDGKDLTLCIEPVPEAERNQFEVHAYKGTSLYKTFFVEECKGSWFVVPPISAWMKSHHFYLADMVRRAVTHKPLY